MKWLDSMTERSARGLAKRTSRRSVIGYVGALLVGTATLPLLPVARGAEPQGRADNGKGAPAQARPPGSRPDANTPGINDPTSCSYWRHCGIDGYLCGCCGGSDHSCPPGTQMSAITWVGTCHNPLEGRDYVISYNDCCGKSSCGRCLCNRNEGDTPIYIPYQSNDYNWCSGSSKANIPYHCSTARIVSVAK